MQLAYRTFVPFIFACLISFVSVPGLAQTGDVGNPVDNSNGQLIKTRSGIFTTRSNPITLPLSPEEDAFQFVIYGDRTGGDPSGLKFLRQAVTDTNLLDPDFVMTVGDLIQGYNRPAEWMMEMREFKDIMSRLNMDWFPVAGNHDIYWDFRDRNRPKGHHESNYEQNFGPLWYSFEHKDQGFVVLFSDEGDAETGEKGFQEARLQNVSDEQLEFLDQALNQLKECSQVFVILHHPRWIGGGYAGSNWPVVHKKLAAAGNVAAVFAGHIHRMTYGGAVDGIEYFTLATTGGHLAMDSPEIGFLHHFNVVTVRENDFSVAAIPVGGVVDPRVFEANFLAEIELIRTMRPTRIGEKLKLELDGSVAGNYSINIPNPGKSPIEITITTELDGNWKVLPDHQHTIIPPGKSEGMKFHFYREDKEGESWEGFSVPRFSMMVEYLHSSARARLPAVSFPVDVTLAEIGEADFAAVDNQCLGLRGKQSGSARSRRSRFSNDSVQINSDKAILPQGAFTLEAWIYPTDISKSRAIVAKTQSSEFALFLHDGRATFDVHLNGKYSSPQAEEKIPLNQWSHVAGVFDGKHAGLYVDGKLIKSIGATGQRTINQLPLFVGADPDGFGNPTREFAGQIDEVRLSIGVRYDSNFEPQSRFQSDDRAVLLLHMDKAFGPFLRNDAKGDVTAITLGRAKISNRR